MNTPDRTWSFALLLGFLLGGIHFGSFSLPVVRKLPQQAVEVSWDGLDPHGAYWNGWQVCKFFQGREGDVLSWSCLANPAFWVGVYLLAIRRWWGATFAGCVASSLAVAGFFFLSNQLMIHISSFLIGYYVWLSGMVALTLASLIGAILQGRHSQEVESRKAMNAEP